jgi:hypothetical protein
VDVAPLVSAYRYRFHVLDAYGGRMGGLARPAGTIEEALKRAAGELKQTANPPVELKRLATQTNAETRTALRDVIARIENDLAIAITKYGTDIGAPPTGPHIEMRTTLDGIDRSYRASDPAPDDFDGWYDQLDAQIGHLASLLALEKELDAARGGGGSVRVPDNSPKRLRWFLVALVVATLAALGIAGLTTFRLPGGGSGSTTASAPPPPAGAESPRMVRTVPITVATPAAQEATTPAPATAAAAGAQCRIFELEVGAGGANLLDAPLGGQPVVRLEPGEKLVLKQVLALGDTRLVEVDVPARLARGFVAENEARLPVMTWTCDR